MSRQAQLSRQERFDKELAYLTEGQIKRVGKYLNKETFVALQHETCGQVFHTTSSNFKENPQCPHCQAK